MRQGAEKRIPGNGFTLIELLIVIAIMALVIGFSIPAFTGMGEGAKIDGAARNLKQACALARQWAVTNRQNVYLLLPNSSASGAAADLKHRAYAIFTQTNGTAIVTSPQGEFIQDWNYLPKGVGFLNTGTTYNFSQGTNSYNNVACFVWKSDGTLDGGSPHRTINIFPGVEIWRKDASPNPEANAEWKAKQIKIRVHRLTGLTKVHYDVNGAD